MVTPSKPTFEELKQALAEPLQAFKSELATAFMPFANAWREATKGLVPAADSAATQAQELDPEGVASEAAALLPKKRRRASSQTSPPVATPARKRKTSKAKVSSKK